MRCQNCSTSTPEDARFCPQCGVLLVKPPQVSKIEGASSPAWWSLVGMLGVSLLISILLTVVFHMPIFILGAAFPLFWRSRRG